MLVLHQKIVLNSARVIALGVAVVELLVVEIL